MTNPIVNQPTSVSLQATDYFLTWQGAQSPSTRKTPVSALSPYYATLSGPNTFAGKITVSSGGASITGNTNVVGTLSASGAVSGTTGTFSGLLTGSAGLSITAGGATIAGGGVTLDNAQFVAWKDSGGVARGVLAADGSNNVLLVNMSGSTTISMASGGGATVNGGLQLNGDLNGTGALQVVNRVTVSGSTAGSVGGAGVLSTGGASTGFTGAVSYAFNASGGGSVVAGAFFATSDARMKSDVAEITSDEALAWVKSGRAVTFTMDGSHKAGFVAQEEIKNGRGASISLIEDDRSEVAESDGVAPAGHRLIKDYEHDIAYLTKALQVALARIEALEARP